MIFRPATELDLSGLAPLFGPDPVGSITAEVFQARIADGQYLPSRTWIAEADPGTGGNGPLALATWWARPWTIPPRALDGLSVGDLPEGADRTDLAAGLLSAAHQAFARDGVTRPPEFHILLPSDWRDREDVTEAVAWRQEAARRAGLTEALERIRYEWTPADGLPGPRGRLTFRAEPDDEVFVRLFTRTLTGTLDSTSDQQRRLVGAEAQARADVEFYRDNMPGERGWWRVAYTADGQPAGYGVPSRNTESPVVGYLGVLPEQRGHGYAEEILAEITRILVEEADAAVINADTDLGNRPMAAAFDRAGYRTLGHRLVLSAPPGA